MGIAGFSAGGNLASVFTNKIVSEKETLHPVFNILFYPVISMEIATKGTSQKNLLGNNPSQILKHDYSSQYLVNSKTPSTIIFASNNDLRVLPFDNSVAYAKALHTFDVPASLYLFPTGGHGWAMHTDFEYNALALSLLSKWLQQFK